MKKLRDMTDSEYRIWETEGKKQPSSEFALFHSALRGYDVFLNDVKIDKWEAFASGFKDVDAILSGNNKVSCKLREPIELEQ